jgi:Cupin-like domain
MDVSPSAPLGLPADPHTVRISGAIRRVAAKRVHAELLGDSPVVITDALGDWHIDNDWTPECLTAKLRHHRVTLSFARNGRFSFNESADPLESAAQHSVTEVDFAAAVDSIFNDRGDYHPYIWQKSIPDEFPELLKSLVIPEPIRDMRGLVMNLWFGRGTETPLHYDEYNNLFSQVYGTKRFILFSVQDSEWLYPFSHRAYMPHISHVDAFKPDVGRFPEFFRATPIEVVLQPGEMLYLPSFWWHQVRSVGVSISVNMWWPPRSAQLVESPTCGRRLWGMYGRDRLAELRGLWLEPNQLEFASAAALMLKHGRKWVACMLALAAFDEQAGRWSPGVREPGCAVADLPAELAHICEAITRRNTLSAAHRLGIASVPRLAASCIHFDDAHIDSKDVAALLRTLLELRDLA